MRRLAWVVERLGSLDMLARDLNQRMATKGAEANDMWDLDLSSQSQVRILLTRLHVQLERRGEEVHSLQAAVCRISWLRGRDARL